jgi:hypothetical protein
MADNFLKMPTIIITNIVISSKNATAPMVLDMMTVLSRSELTVGVVGGAVTELMFAVVRDGISNIISVNKKLWS